MKSLFNMALVVSMLFGCWACEKEEVVTPALQNKLVADAGEDLEVLVGSTLTLDGSASKDGNGKAFVFDWNIISKPNNSSALILQSGAAKPTFTPDQAGTYVVELRISNAASQQATDRVIITALGTGDSENPTDPMAVVLSQHITTDTELKDIFEDDALADYIITTDLVVKAKLTIKPGVVIAFEQDKSLMIHPEGALIAKGTSAQRIIFRGTDHASGYWKGIGIISNSPLNEMEHVLVHGGGSNSLAEIPNIKANLVLAGDAQSGAALKVSASSFYASAGYGMYVQGMSELSYFYGNYFVDNAGVALYVPARQVHKLDFYTHFNDNNGYNGVETGGTLRESAEVSWPDFNDGSSYLISEHLIIESGLLLARGTTLEFEVGVSAQVLGSGYLNATGDDYNKIVFTARTKTQQGAWKGILFNTRSEQNRIFEAEVSYGGNGDYTGANVPANISIGASGTVSVQNVQIMHGLGWGIVANTALGAQLNSNVLDANTFVDLPLGAVKTDAVNEEPISLTGEWLDEWSFNHAYAMDDLVYNKSTQVWFRGAASPRTMNPQAGFGLRIDEAGNYLWTIAEYGPPTGCGETFSAEYITGKLSANGHGEIYFQESYWRSMFYNGCDTSQNVNTEVTPGSMMLKYAIEKVYDVWTGEPSFRLTFTNPDGSSFRYYRK